MKTKISNTVIKMVSVFQLGAELFSGSEKKKKKETEARGKKTPGTLYCNIPNSNAKVLFLMELSVYSI